MAAANAMAAAKIRKARSERGIRRLSRNLLNRHLLPLPLLVKRRTNRGGPMLGVAPRHDRETAESWSYVDHRPRHDLGDCANTRPVLDLILTGRAGT